MKILSLQHIIEKSDCLIAAKNNLKGGVQILKLECNGAHQWNKEFLSYFGIHAMIQESGIFDLPEDNFLVWQASEHSRGAHNDFEFQLMKSDGSELLRIHSRIYTQFVLDEKYLWFLFEDPNEKGSFGSYNNYLCQYNIVAAKMKQKILLNFKELSGIDYQYLFNPKLVEKENTCVVEVKIGFEGDRPSETLSMPISRFK